MSRTPYNTSNQAKASFDATYDAPTPHRYLANMAAVDYRLAERLHPFLSSVIDASKSPDGAVKILDVGCSYGISAGLLKTDCSYEELTSFLLRRTEPHFDTCVEKARVWLHDRIDDSGVEVVGLDRSGPAINFATETQLIDTGISRNLENPEAALSAEDQHSIAECDVLFSAGTIGYVSDRTMDPILDELGAESRGPIAPVAVMSVLELFEPEPIAETFHEHGFRFGVLPFSVCQRKFVDASERARVIETLQQRGTATDLHKTENRMFATLCVAAHPEHFEALTECVTDTAESLDSTMVTRCELV